MSTDEPKLWTINTGPEEQIKINGILYVARKTRGPHNVEFTTRDLQYDSEHISRIGNLPLKYNHGFDDRFGDREIGNVTSAKLTNTGAIFIECQVTQNEARLPYELREIIREELRSGKLGMFSMYWDARTIGEIDGQPVVDPSDRQFHEVSLCEKGFYPEARIVSFAASSDSGALSKFRLLTVFISSTITDSPQEPVMATTEQPSAGTQQQQQAPAQTSTPSQAWKFDGFQQFGFQKQASEYLTKQLETIDPEQRKSITSSERSIGDWTSKVVDDTFAKHMVLLEKEQQHSAKIVAEQQQYLKSLEPKAKDIFGDQADEVLKMMNEKASTPSSDFKLFQTLSQQVVDLRSGAIEKRTNSGDKFIKAASATDGEQSAKRFGMPTPETPDNGAESAHHRMLMGFLGRKAMQNLRCVRCLKDYDPANNAFGACTWHSNHNFAKSTPTYVSIEEELRTVLPRFKTSFGKVDIEYILSKITLKDLMLQIDSPVTRAIRGKLDTIPESIAKLLVEYPVEKLYDVISSRYSYDKQYQPTKRMALIMENMLTSMRIEDIDAQLKDETDRLDTQFRYPHPHLFRGKYFAGGRYVWRCCGLPETVEGCWTGVHSSVQRSPDPFTVANFENANYRAFYDNINLIVNGSEHVNNPIKNQTLRTLCSSSIGANFNTKKQEFIKKVIAFNFYNGYEPTFIRAEGVQFGCSWQESERVQSCRDEKVEDLIEFSNLRLLVVFHPPRYRLSEYTITTVVHKLTRGVIFKSDEVFQYGSMIPLQPDLYLPIPANSRLPEGTLLLPNSATRYLPRNPVSVTQATLAEFELLESQPSNRLKRRQRVRITQLSDAEWAPYEALRQAQLNSAIAEYQKQQRRAGELAVRRQTADQLLLDVQNAVRQSTRIPGSEPFVKLVEKMVTKQYDELFGLPRKQQIALLRDMNATVDLAGIVLRQKDLEDQITQGSLVITTPLTPEESNDFQKDIAEIMKRTDAARTEYDQALQKTKASPETKQLGLETLQILGEHTEFLRKAASGVKLYEEATIITESSSKVLETFEHLRDLFVKGRFGRAVVVNVVVPKEFHSKLMKIDMRLKNWHLKNTIPGVDKEEKLQELYQFYSKLRSFKEKYSPLKFSTNLKEDVTLVAREADQAFTDALQALNLGKLDEPSVIQIVDLLNTAIESSRVWSIKVRSFSGEVISTDELQRFIFYDNIEKELNMDIDEEKESMFEKFLTLTPPNFEELDIFAKARIVLYHNLLTFCSQTALFHKFVYKMQDWLQRYVAYQFQSVGEEYVIFDPVFGHEVVGNNGISFVASGLEAGFVANLVNNGYTVASYNALTLENFNVMKVLFQRISELNSPALMKTLAALKKEVNSIQTASAQRADFFQVCQAYETTDFLYVDGIFPEWDRIEKLDETFGYGKGFMRTKYKLDSVLELYQEIQKVVGRLKLYFENFYIFDEENKYLDQIARRNIDYFSNISEKVLKEIVETARQLLKTLSWTKRFRSKEDLGDLIKLWTEINFPINNASRYGEKVTRVIDYLRKMNLLIGVTENQIQGIFRQINSAGKDFQKIVPDVVLPLSNSCKVELTNYVVPKVLQPGDIQSPLNLVRNLEKLKFNPKFYLHPPKGIKFKAEVHSVVHVYEVQ